MPARSLLQRSGSDDGAASSHAAYLVVPQDFRTFRADRRQALGVLGDYYRGAPESENLRGKSGFLAWLTAEAPGWYPGASVVSSSRTGMLR